MQASLILTRLHFVLMCNDAYDYPIIILFMADSAILSRFSAASINGFFIQAHLNRLYDGEQI